MSTEQFVASLVSSLALPAAALGIAAIFRVQLRRLLSGKLLRLKAGPIEAEFDRLASLVQVTIPEAVAATDTSPLSQQLRGLAEASPTGAIIEAQR